jgi:hypothetical protein
MTDRFGFITYKMYVLQRPSLFLLFNSFFPFLIIKTNTKRKRERVREEKEEGRKAILGA